MSNLITIYSDHTTSVYEEFLHLVKQNELEAIIENRDTNINKRVAALRLHIKNIQFHMLIDVRNTFSWIQDVYCYAKYEVGQTFDLEGFNRFTYEIVELEDELTETESQMNEPRKWRYETL